MSAYLWKQPILQRFAHMLLAVWYHSYGVYNHIKLRIYLYHSVYFAGVREYTLLYKGYSSILSNISGSSFTTVQYINVKIR